MNRYQIEYVKKNGQYVTKIVRAANANEAKAKILRLVKDIVYLYSVVEAA